MNLEDKHKQMGIDLFNSTWDLIDLKDRTKEQDMEMIHSAHASAYHWLKAGGTKVNEARSQWQISRVYTLVNMGEAALFHGLASLNICIENEIGDFDLAFGYEAVARAYETLENKEKVREYKQLALEACEKIASVQDREYAISEIENIS